MAAAGSVVVWCFGGWLFLGGLGFEMVLLYSSPSLKLTHKNPFDLALTSTKNDLKINPFQSII